MSNSDHDLLWYAEQNGGYPNGYSQVVQIAEEELGLIINERDVRKHFEYHRPRQAKPAKRLRYKKASQLINKLTVRQKQIIDLIFRVPGLSALEIGVMIYWSGEADKIVAAEKAALRNLRRLQRLDMIFRCYLENLPGTGYRPEKAQGIYFLNSNGRHYIENNYQLRITSTEERFSDQDFKNWFEAWSKYKQHSIFSRIIKEMPGEMNNRYLLLNENVKLCFSSNNWLDVDNLRLTFKDPIRQARTLKISGLAALTLTVSDPTNQRKNNFLLPFFYLVDDKSRRMDYLIEDLMTPFALARSGEIQKVLPEYPDPFQPLPTIVIVTETERLRSLERELRKTTNPRKGTILLSDQYSFAKALTESIWTDPFQKSQLQNKPNKINLIQYLTDYYREKPLISDQLVWKRQLPVKRPSK
jgi:hypothetical protein